MKTGIPYLTFEEEGHVYKYRNKVVDSVTQILSKAGLSGNPFYTLASAERGKAVHLMTALYDRGLLDEDELPDWMRGYLESWKQFLATAPVIIIDIEKFVFHAKAKYAGTVDRTAYWESVPAIIDIKSGVYERWHELQLWGYGDTDYRRDLKHLILIGVYLKSSGGFPKIKHADNIENLYDWRAAIRIARWKEKK